MSVELQPVAPTEGAEFLKMAQLFFLDLNPKFVPHADWKEQYFDNILASPQMRLRWIVGDEGRVGFVLFGLEKHLFLPRWSGSVYALYVRPEFRRKGLARACALQVIEELQSSAPSKLQLEVMENNRAALAFWEALGFERTSVRLVRRNDVR